MAPKSDKNKKEIKKRSSEANNYEDLSLLDKAAKNIFSIIDNTYTDRQILSAKDQKIRSILDRELEVSKGVSQGSIIDFVASMQIKDQRTKNTHNSMNSSSNASDTFMRDINDVFGFFQDLYKNRYLEISDLKFIAKFIPALGEAVKTTLDSVVSSDNVAESVNREIKLPAGTSEEYRDEIINEIIRNEKELKLLKKLKNTVYKKALVTGTHYVYAKSYNKIFEEFDRIKKRDDKINKPNNSNQFGSSNTSAKSAKESFSLGDVDISGAMESVKSLLSSATDIETGATITSNKVNSIINECRENMPIITCEQSMIYSEALDDVSHISNNSFVMEAFTKKFNDNKKKDKKENISEKSLEENILSMGTPDGTKGTNDMKPSKFDVSGTYIKYIDQKNMVPVTVFDQKIGYFLIKAKAKNNKNSAGTATSVNNLGSTLFGTVNVADGHKNEAIEKIADSISEGILQNFDKKFVVKHSEYKKMIADCIIANGLTDKDYNIQFIPAEDIIEFTINEDEDGNGESILTDSLFPAKLLLSMMVCRLLNYINKTGNKTIAHVYKGPVNAFTNNQINRVIRDLQEQSITFNDLLSPNLVFNKFNRDGNIALPTAKNGSHLIEFETQEGQNIDMSPEYEKELENMAILGTGVPTVIMEYAGSADFAKQLVSANIKYAGRISSLQADLEDPTTELYKRICQNSNMSNECKRICMQSLEIKLPRPKVLINGNNNEYVRTVVETAESIADTALGRDSITDKEVMKNGVQIKEKVVYDIVRKSSPFIDWEEIDDIVKKRKAEYVNKPTDDNKDGSSSESEF